MPSISASSARVSPAAGTRLVRSNLIGNSAAIQSIKDLARSIASRRSTVMIAGETGTGKEMLARHIHCSSDRAAQPFVPVDCSSLVEGLFESQLFGHVRGAFTGAMRDSIGFIRAAHGGTLFLDEIGEMPLASQAKLLRVVQERAVVPVGDSTPHPVDIRIICATHRNLAEMVKQSSFREDLYFRLNVITMKVPPLRDRPADILLLAQHFLHQQAELYGEVPKQLSPAAASALMAYPWPGNVRELANVVEHAHVLADGAEIQAEDLHERIAASPTAASASSDLLLVNMERRIIIEALQRTDQNKAAAARLLGLNIQKMKRRIEKLKIALH
ncbi:MAG TPA: sigma 54-interacting transcriptional regulator [Tepidisphaeraceae bacterium]|jgi:transcriptional regulator with PAS, ATPase and Fis domain